MSTKGRVRGWLGVICGFTTLVVSIYAWSTMLSGDMPAELTPTVTVVSTATLVPVLPTSTWTIVPTETFTKTPRPPFPTYTPAVATPVVVEMSMWRCPDSVEGAAFMASENSSMFHEVECRHADTIEAEERICFAHKEAALAFDYLPCNEYEKHESVPSATVIPSMWTPTVAWTSTATIEPPFTPLPPPPFPTGTPTPLPPFPTPDDGTPVPPLPTVACDPAYPEVCIAPYPPDLNCKDVPYKNFVVLPSDPHGFDRDKDGWGCEK